MRILVVKLRHHGDVLLTSPLFTSLKSLYPESEIDAYLYKETLPMLEGHPAISDFLLYDRSWKRGFFSRWKRELFMLWQIRKRRYDMIIQLTEGDRGAIVAGISGAKVRVGFDPKGEGFWKKEKCFSHLIPHGGMRHTVEMQLDALRTLGHVPKMGDRELLFHVPSNARKRIKELVDGPYVLIHPVSRWMFKAWPVEKVAALLQELKGEQIVMSAGPDSVECEFVAKAIALSGVSVINLAGQLSLKELGALIEGAKAMITVDSVPMHMAAALKVPLVAVFGPTSEERWAPWLHPNAQIVFQNMPCRPCYQPGCQGSHRSECLETLEVQEVVKSFLQLEV